MTARVMLRGWLMVLGAAMLVGGVPLPAAAQAGETAGGARLVVHSASGGISKGSYQGGVDWTISEFLRRQRDDIAFRDRLHLRPHETFELGSLTGASAGNINALFAALGWCTRSVGGASTGHVQPIAAETSLFWQAWVTTGVGDLLPLDRRSLPESAALSRELFETQHKHTIWDFLQKAVPMPDCHVPVGLTLTKLTPIEVAIAGGRGAAKVQRFSSVFEVTSRARLDFAFPDERKIAPKESLGAVALLGSLRGTTPETRDTRLNDVFNVVLASSAFPIAFAPREVCYESGGLRPLDGASTNVPPCPRFIDGGVFDNNPLGLAVRLAELSRSEGRVLPRVEVAYTSPDSFRGRLQRARDRQQASTDREGIGAFVQLGRGALASARQYELQSLARQLARDAEAAGATEPATLLLQSSRNTPIVGETLGSFGAFLGQPFREYDFYAGIYDGLHFVARHFLCAKDRLDQPGAPASVAPPGVDPRVDDCAAREHVRLVEDNPFGVSDMAHHVSMWLRDAEYAPGTDTPKALQGEDVLRGRVLRGIHDAFAQHHDEPWENAACSRISDPVQRVLCPGGLDHALAQLAGNNELYAAAATLGGRCAAAAAAPCHVDQPFLDLLDAPRRHVYLLAKKAIENIEHGEDALKGQEPPLKEYSAWVEAAFSLFRASTLKYRNGIKGSRVELNMSTGRWDNGHLLASAANVVLPNYVTWAPGKPLEDPVTLGWRPLTVPLTEQLFVSTNVEVSMRHPPVRQLTWARRTAHLAYGATFGSFAWHPLGTTTVEAGVYRMPTLMAAATGSDSTWAARVSGRWVSDKVFGAVAANRSSITVQVGLSDLNGLVYWWLR